jgi:hypothetical protein
MKNILSWLTVFLFLFSANLYAQDESGVSVSPRHNQSIEQMNNDKSQCALNADQQFDKSNHRTLKRTGIGAGIGAAVGTIFGIPGIGAASGGAAGGISGHRKNNKEEKAYNETYAACLRDKGYDVEVYDD